MKALVRLGGAAALVAGLAPSAFAQIISTSLPTADAGAGRDRFSAHVMVTPLAKWDYGEAYLEQGAFTTPTGYDAFEDVGTIHGSPSSNFMTAAEAAFGLGESDWSVALGGWYNKIGNHEFDLTLTSSNFWGEDALGHYDFWGSASARVPLELVMYEGHLGLFYRGVGIQGGVIRTRQKLEGDMTDYAWEPSPKSPGQAMTLTLEDYYEVDETTTDFDVFAVVRKSAPRWGVSLGAGPYFKQGISEDSPLRSAENKVVFSAFATASVSVFKGLSLDASYWYVGKTDWNEKLVDTRTASADSQSRFTVGVGYSF